MAANTKIQPVDSLLSDKGKDTNKSRFRTQKERFYKLLQYRTLTCSMASDLLRIPQKNCTWYKKQLQEAGKLWEVKISRCKLTGFMAAYLSTNPDKAPTNPPERKQLSIQFDSEEGGGNG